MLIYQECNDKLKNANTKPNRNIVSVESCDCGFIYILTLLKKIFVWDMKMHILWYVKQRLLTAVTVGVRSRNHLLDENAFPNFSFNNCFINCN
jgi:hypothetical protein